MPTTFEQDVARFNTLAGKPVGTYDFYDPARRASLIEWLKGELQELEKAHEEEDPVEFLDAIVDLTYFGVQYAVEVYPESHFTQAWNIVHAANMSKVDGPGLPIKNEAGRIMKPEGFTPPNIAFLAVSAYWSQPIVSMTPENPSKPTTVDGVKEIIAKAPKPTKSTKPTKPKKQAADTVVADTNYADFSSSSSCDDFSICDDFSSSISCGGE
jgi:hypothetical protein